MILAIVGPPDVVGGSDEPAPSGDIVWHVVPSVHGCLRFGHATGRTDAYVDDGSLSVVAASDPAASTALAIAAAYRSHGLGAVRRLDGPFAFVLHDARSGVTVAASTLTSRAPLAYAVHGGVVAVGSRILPLLRHVPGLRPRLDEAYLAHTVLGYAAAAPGTTPIAGVRRLPAGMALFVRGGEATEIRVDALSPRSSGAGADEVDAFWSALGDAVARASAGRTSVALSSGLDSSAVAAACVARGAPLDAIAMVAPDRASVESRGIDALERAWPSLRLHRVDTAGDDAYPALDASPLRDDPTLLPLSLFPARMHLWSAAREAGFDTLLDGEGGDELFGGWTSALDALQRGRWRALGRFLRSDPRRRSTLLRAIVLPHAPLVVRRRWTRRWAAAGDLLPAYLEPGALRLPAFEQATLELYDRWIQRPAIDVTLDGLGAPTDVGARLAHEDVARRMGVRLASPLLDREVVERVLGLDPAATLGLPADKRFLREALRGRVPEQVRTQPKDVRLAQVLGTRVIASTRAEQPLRDPRVRERLSPWIRFDKLEALLAAIRSGYAPSEWLAWQVECAITLAEWYARASREYGVV